MKTINPFEISKTEITERSNEDHLLELFFTETTNKYHVVFNAKTMGSYKTKVGAVKLANKLIYKYQLN